MYNLFGAPPVVDILAVPDVLVAAAVVGADGGDAAHAAAAEVRGVDDGATAVGIVVGAPDTAMADIDAAADAAEEVDCAARCDTADRDAAAGVAGAVDAQNAVPGGKMLTNCSLRSLIRTSW